MKTFYASLFDWKLMESPDKDPVYTHIDTGEGPGGGIMSGEQGVPSTQINNGGSFSVIQDPSGACIGLYQP